MSIGTESVPHCQHCGRPIGGIATWIGNQPFHYECTRSPSHNPTFLPAHVFGVGAQPSPALTEADVRRIVRDELAKATKEPQR